MLPSERIICWNISGEGATQAQSLDVAQTIFGILHYLDEQSQESYAERESQEKCCEKCYVTCQTDMWVGCPTGCHQSQPNEWKCPKCRRTSKIVDLETENCPFCGMIKFVETKEELKEEKLPGKLILESGDLHFSVEAINSQVNQIVSYLKSKEL